MKALTADPLVRRTFSEGGFAEAAKPQQQICGKFESKGFSV
jgi:hypothetical protein